MSEERVYEAALRSIAFNGLPRCPCCVANLATAQHALGLPSSIPTLTEVGSAHGLRTDQKGCDAQGPRQEAGLAHYPV